MTLNVRYLIRIFNYNYRNYSIQKLEWPSTRYFIPARGGILTTNESIPWCVDAWEIPEKAFLIRKGATTRDDGEGQFYLFQNRSTIYTCAFDDPTAERAQRWLSPYPPYSYERFNLEIYAGYHPPAEDFLVVNDADR